jgi:hypothetical protein
VQPAGTPSDDQRHDRGGGERDAGDPADSAPPGVLRLRGLVGRFPGGAFCGQLLLAWPGHPGARDRRARRTAPDLTTLDIYTHVMLLDEVHDDAYRELLAAR